MEQTRKRSDYDGHILYKKNCAYCQTEYWAKKIDGTCCSGSCRNLKKLENKKKLAK